jgi:hypothetical protein
LQSTGVYDSSVTGNNQRGLTVQERAGTTTITSDLLERLDTFGRLMERCADADIRSAYNAEIRVQTPEALCFVGLGVGEAKRRGLDTSDWPNLTIGVPVGEGTTDTDDDTA